MQITSRSVASVRLTDLPDEIKCADFDYPYAHFQKSMPRGCSASSSRTRLPPSPFPSNTTAKSHRAQKRQIACRPRAGGSHRQEKGRLFRKRQLELFVRQERQRTDALVRGYRLRVPPLIVNKKHRKTPRRRKRQCGVFSAQRFSERYISICIWCLSRSGSSYFSSICRYSSVNARSSSSGRLAPTPRQLLTRPSHASFENVSTVL